MFIKVTGVSGEICILNTNDIRMVDKYDDESLTIFGTKSNLVIKGNLDEFYQRLNKTND